MRKIIHLISNWFAELCGWLLLIIVFSTLADMVSRNLNMPIQGVIELSVFVLIAVVYLGIPYCEVEKTHVRITVILSRLPKKLRQFVNVLIYFIAFLLTILLVFSVGSSVLRAFESKESIAGTVPMVTWPTKFSIFIGCLFYCLNILINGIDNLLKLYKK